MLDYLPKKSKLYELIPGNSQYPLSVVSHNEINLEPGRSTKYSLPLDVTKMES